MEFHRLSLLFYKEFGIYEEILTKEDRPYYVLVLELDNITYAIPLRSHITHPYCFIADNSTGENCGLNYSKTVIISDPDKFFMETNISVASIPAGFF